MGGRWLVQTLLLVTVGLVACGDNRINHRDGGGDDDAPIDAIDAPTDVPTDVPIDVPDMAPDMMIDAACDMGTNPMQCPSGCTDVSMDPTNCGQCGTMCDAGQMCTSGICCDMDEAACGSTCANFMNDDMHCGDCDTACAGTESCVSGECRADCSGSEMNCGAAPGTCVDTQSDNDHCGACNNACDPGETCNNGQCECDTPDTCTDGTTTTCTNVDNDPANCGTCGNACPSNQVCSNGVCTATCQAPAQNCNGSCANTNTDPFNCGNCGIACDAGQVCSGGTCTSACASGTDCFGACVDISTDEQNCGTTAANACGNACPIGATCTGGACVCPGSTVACDGVCVDLLSDEAHCGSCGAFCGTGESCNTGVCQTVCGGSMPDRCGMAPGICTNFQTDEANCGVCGKVCGDGQTCTNGVCLTDCPPSGGPAANDDRCGATASNPGFCTDTQTDEQNCGTCGAGCAANRQCLGGDCECFGATPDDCNGACTNTNSDPLNCGACGAPCTPGMLCMTGTCVPNCMGGTTNCNGSCVDTDEDELNCGTCGSACPIGATCTNGGCQCPSGQVDCNGRCVDLSNDPEHCGSCPNACDFGDQCSSGTCCDQGQTSCSPGTCSNLKTDPDNCGTCGNACGDGETCNNGVCECGYGFDSCNGACIPTATDPNNCGGCGVKCTGTNDVCVSNGCASTCPPPLIKCGGQCINPSTDSDHCGSCGGANSVCGDGLGCSDGACVPVVNVGADPDKCVGGGPPIFVPTGGEDTCTGNLGSVSFTFAMCSKTDIQNLTQNLTTDAFNSAQGPYVPGGLGGSIGVNGFYENNKTTVIGGDLFVRGASGFTPAGNTTIRQRMLVYHNFVVNKLLTVSEPDDDSDPADVIDTYIGGTITSAGGQPQARVHDLVVGTSNCAAMTAMNPLGLPATLIYDAPCIQNKAAVDAFFVNPTCSLEDIPVGSIVQHFSTTATNDNELIGLDPNALNNTNAQRLELPCGYYYLNAIAGSAPMTIVVHGRTALFIGGNVDLSNELYIDLEPGATLDVFIAGYLNTSQSMTLGNPNYPRLSRFYIGGVNSTGESLKLSGGSTFLNGVFWAGHGDIRASNSLEMFGALFANSFHLQGEVKVHYDEGVVQNGEECPPLSGTCDTCRDCDNQACTAGECGKCTSDAQCCAPLRCVDPGPMTGHCEL